MHDSTVYRLRFKNNVNDNIIAREMDHGPASIYTPINIPLIKDHFKG